MKLKSIASAFSVAVALMAATANGQFAPSGGDVPGLEQAMRKLFEKVDGFTGTANMTISGQGPNVKLTVDMAMLNGDARTEVDLTKMEGAAIPPQMISQLKAAGMDKAVTINYAKDGSSVIIYPGLKSYAEVTPGKPAPAGGNSPECKVEKTPLGAEDVGGKSCDKNTVKVKCEGQPEVVLTVWSDKARKDLPVKLSTTQEGVSMTIEFTQFTEGKPDAKLFALPSEYKKYASAQELMMANMQKLMQAAPGQ